MKNIKEKDLVTIWQNVPFTTYAWAQDFVRALAQRPKIIRILLRFIFGKYAYREFIGMVDGFIIAEMYMNYELEHMDYHQEKTRNDFKEGLRLY